MVDYDLEETDEFGAEKSGSEDVLPGEEGEEAEGLSGDEQADKAQENVA